jgi:hypothetical protein
MQVVNIVTTDLRVIKLPKTLMYYIFAISALFYVDRGLAMGRSLVPRVQAKIHSFRLSFASEQVRISNS